MDKPPMVSRGNPMAVVFAVLTVVGIKYGYVSSADWNILAYISAPLFFVALIVFRDKPVTAKTKSIVRKPVGRRAREIDNHLWL